MAGSTVADYVLGRLREWEVDTVFAYAGDGIGGLLAAWGRAHAARFARQRPYHQQRSI